MVSHGDLRDPDTTPHDPLKNAMVSDLINGVV